MATIRGADITVQTDLGQAPFILDRDQLDADPGSVLTPADDAWSDITCDILGASWAWGSSAPLGPLTQADAGRARFTFLDPDRDYDPSNDASPYAGVLHVGLPIRVLADGVPAWTGTLDEWSHDQGDLTSTLQAVDPIGTLAARILPGGTAIAAGLSAAQANAILDAAGWPADRRAFDGGSAANRNAITADGSALDGLADVRFAELADLFATRDGGIGWRGRSQAYEPDPVAVINCGGAPLGDLASVFAQGRVRNVVLVDGATPSRYSIPESATRHGPRYVKTTAADLAFAAGSLLRDRIADRLADAPTVSPLTAPTSQTIVADRSSVLAQSPGGTGLGGGQDDHLPCGTSGGYRLRAIIGFPPPDWTGISGLVSAVLRLKTSDYAHLTPGSSPRITVNRITESWPQNGAGETWTTAAEAYPGPSVTGTGSVSPSITAAQNATVDIDVTAMLRAIAPPSAGGSGAKWYGLKAYPYQEDASSRNCEFWSAERPSADRPRLILTLTAGAPPFAPVLVAPIGEGAAAGTFSFHVADPQGDAITSWRVQLKDATGAIVWTSADGAGTLTGDLVAVPYTGPAYTAQRYSWTAQAKDATTWGPWATASTFTPGSLPPTPTASWAQAILSALGQPAVLTQLGTISPEGTDVAAILGGEYGARWRVVHDETDPPINRIVRVLGQAVTIGPGRIDVDATTEDV